jgi:hypothetical protein
MERAVAAAAGLLLVDSAQCATATGAFFSDKKQEPLFF